jgi:hypothetical protein
MSSTKLKIVANSNTFDKTQNKHKVFCEQNEVDNQSFRNKYYITHVPFKTLIIQCTRSISPTKFVASFHLRHLCLKASSPECLEALTWRDNK